MSTTQQQYNAVTPSSKRLTIIDDKDDDAPSWTIKKFYYKGTSDVLGATSNTKKVRVKVLDNNWPFSGRKYSSQWFWGKTVVVTHRKLGWDVYSGHIDDITEKNRGWTLTLYVTDVEDRA